MERELDLEFTADTAREMHNKAEALRTALDDLDRSFSTSGPQCTVNACAASLMSTVFDFLASLRMAGRYP
jgi:hypothetical protein